MISDLSKNGAISSLERLVQFTEQRQRVLANNVANLSTPSFQPSDLDPQAFQQTLSKAIEQTRRSHNAEFKPENTRQLTFHRDTLEVKPEATNENVMFHDGNNRDLDRIMQDIAENQLTHQFGITMLRNQFSLLRSAIREEV